MNDGGCGRIHRILTLTLLVTLGLAAGLGYSPSALAQKQPNIVAIMADDIGWFNIGAYHQGIMASKTPNLDRLAADSFLFDRAIIDSPRLDLLYRSYWPGQHAITANHSLSPLPAAAHQPLSPLPFAGEGRRAQRGG